MTVTRHGGIVGLHEKDLAEYKRLHTEVWPDVLKTISACNIRHYSIYLRKLDDGKYYLFSHFEYTGEDLESDMAKMAADPATQRWWDICMPMQRPLESRAEGEWWAMMEEVFYYEG